MASSTRFRRRTNESGASALSTLTSLNLVFVRALSFSVTSSASSKLASTLKVNASGVALMKKSNEFSANAS